MPSKPKYYTKKPVVIEAIQYEGILSLSPVIDFIAMYHDEDEIEDIITINTNKVADEMLSITTLEGIMTVRPGWWIIRGLKGEWYPCDPEVFSLSYEDA